MARTSLAHFAGNVYAPADARRFAASRLPSDASPTRLADVAMVVSELVTNAVRAGAETIQLALTLDGRRVRIEVTDDVAGWPAMRDAGEEDVTGRGLPLVAALAERWGVEPNDPTGKHVWATLPLLGTT
jgi:anti-sigma regulatory factor (Ser/Thr protein kinase)